MTKRGEVEGTVWMTPFFWVGFIQSLNAIVVGLQVALVVFSQCDLEL